MKNGNKVISATDAMILEKAKAFFFPAPTITPTNTMALIPNQDEVKKNVSRYIMPTSTPRFTIDVLGWRNACREAEAAWFPHRVEMQLMFNDTILWGHVEACWQRRKDLTLLRDFRIVNEDGTTSEAIEQENDDLKKMFLSPWFQDFCSFALDAQGFGYSLIALDDLEDNEFKNMHVVQRWNISPDRHNVTAYRKAINGINFLSDPEVKLWHVWVPTTNELGNSNCGFGLFYKVAYYAIFLRNNLGANMTYADNYGQPMRKGTTSKTEEEERANFAQALAAMGEEAWILLDPTDDVELIESKSTGTGYKVYESIEQRMEKSISKILLGHADGLDSVPGKLGASAGEDNPVAVALMDKQTKDGKFLEPIINRELLPRMRQMGFIIPEGKRLEFKNDDEKEALRIRQDASNKVTAEIAQTMKNGGLEMDPKYFTERTSIPCTKIVVPPPIPPGGGDDSNFNKKVTARLRKLYAHIATTETA